jgi:nucleoside-diphosphate-sugar epimerase
VISLVSDLNDVIGDAEADIAHFRNARLYVTGGTGFIGTWFLASIVHANARLGTSIRVDILTRDPDGFARRSPAIAHAAGITLVRGDVRRAAPSGSYDAVVNAATPASAALNEHHPAEMVDTIVAGQQATLAVAARSGAIPFLFTSSGAIYGPQPVGLTHIPEDYGGGPDPLQPRSAYHEGKRVAELLGAIAVATGGPSVRVGRLFAFVGPYLPIGTHFAVGNLLRDALADGPIVVTGDGTAVRSYLYAADMTTWLWAILARGSPGRAYNVGSEHGVSISELARAVSQASGRDLHIDVRGRADALRPLDRYVPSTARARDELGVRERTSLDEALRRTLHWHRSSVAPFEAMGSTDDE